MKYDREAAPRFAGIGGHHSHSAGTVEWLTPPDFLEKVGGWRWYGLDPCAPAVQPWPTARRVFTKRDNGLIQPWGTDQVWLNPPYAHGELGRWLARLAEHGRGMALIFARTDTAAFNRHVRERATAVLFMEGRMTFRVGEPFTDPRTGKRYELGDEAPGNAGAPTVLCAYGMPAADVLAAAPIPGLFAPLNIPRSVIASFLAGDQTWAEVVAEFARDRDGPFPLADLYRFVRAHPKASGNRNPDAKARQILQREGYRRVDRGLWEGAS